MRVERTRTIQVLGQFTAETHTCSDEALLEAGEDAVAVRRNMVEALDRELTSWEASIRASIKSGAHAAAMAGASILPPAAAASPRPTASAMSEGASPATAPPAGNLHNQPLIRTAETMEAIRIAAAKLQDATNEPIDPATVPKDEAGARKFLADLEAAIKQLPAKAPTVPSELGPPAPKAVLCSNAKAHRIPVGLAPEVAAYSQKHFARPLCRACQYEARRRGR